MTMLSSSTQVQTGEAKGQCRITHPPASRRFEWFVTLFAAWIVAGTLLDGWAHNTLRGEIETFFTPWHAVLYSGFAVTSGLIVITHFRNVLQGYHWTRALPKGYMLSLLGIVVFGLSGGADFLWHTLFGFEVDTEALLSPAHLALATGGILIMSSPLRAAWLRSNTEPKQGWVDYGPIVISLLSAFSIFTFFTQFSNPFTHANIFTMSRPEGDPYFWDVTLISYVLIPAGLMMSFIFFAIRRWTLPVGSLTLLLTGNAVLMFLVGIRHSSQQWPILIAALAGGLLADILLVVLKPSSTRVGNLRLFGFVVPFAFFVFYFAALLVSGGIWWRIHMWLGATVLAGIIGLGLSFLAVPPTVPTE